MFDTTRILRKKTPLIALIDCNNFFASCESVFQPSLQEKAIIVLSNNDGCVIARSTLAKQYGIPMGAPYYKDKEFCRKKNIVVFSSNFPLYGDFSQRVHSILFKFFPEVKIYSIDEAFVTFPTPHSEEYVQEATFHAQRVREIILKWLNISVSIGIGSTKSIAKIANKIAKKDPSVRGVYNMSTTTPPKKVLSTLPVQALWGISHRSSKRLHKHSIITAWDFYIAPASLIQKLLSIQGERIHCELHGEPIFTIESTLGKKKSIRSTRSFGKPLTEKEELMSAISFLTSIACEKLRKNNQRAQSVYLYIRTDLHGTTQQYTNGATSGFHEALLDTPSILAHCRNILNRIYIKRYLYVKAGIVLMNLCQAYPYQSSIFEPYSHFQNEALMQIIDKINAIQGKQTLFIASQKSTTKWHPRCNFQSPHYTTKWEDLACVM